MKCDKHTMLLYAVTDRAWVGEQTLYQQVESALKGGATCVQLREKQLGDADFYRKPSRSTPCASNTVCRCSSTITWR